MATAFAKLTSNAEFPVLLDLNFGPNGAGTPNIPPGMAPLIQSISRSSAGTYVLTLNNQWPTPEAIIATVGDNSLANLCANAGPFANTAVSAGSAAPGAVQGAPQGGSTLTVFVYNGSNGSGTDMTANASNLVNVKIYWNNTAVRPL